MYKDIMEPGEKAILSYDAPFLNSDNIFIEFYDVIRSPHFILLNTLKDNDIFKNIFDISCLNNMNLNETYEWYVKRKYRELLLNFPLCEGVMYKLFMDDESEYLKWCKRTSNELLTNNAYFINSNTNLNFAKAIPMLQSGNLVKHTYIYTESYNEHVEKFILMEYGNNINYIYGDFKKVVKENINNRNTTYVISDIMKINLIHELNLLQYSSIAVASKYGYNYTEDNKLKIDIEKKFGNIVFKIDFFDNITSLV